VGGFRAKADFFDALILVAHVYICFDKRSGWFLLLKLVIVCGAAQWWNCISAM